MREDLKKHLLFGRLIALAVTLCAAFGLLNFSELPSPAVALVASSAGFFAGERAGWLKEHWWDAKGRGTVDEADYEWTRKGALQGALLAFVALLVAGALL